MSPTETATIGPDWDDSRYDFLSDHYAMHVNPIYWRLAGWVDDRLEEWKYANGVFGDDFWTGTWVGVLPDVQPAPRPVGTPTGTAEPEPPSGLPAMEELAATIAATGLSSLYDVGNIDLSGTEGPVGGHPGPGEGGHGGAHGGGGHAHAAV